MARTSPPTDRVVATISLLAAHPDESLTLAELTRRLQPVDRARHPHQFGRRRLGARISPARPTGSVRRSSPSVAPRRPSRADFARPVRPSSA
jgi:hypothetical protein